jgi:hypothetical protein
MNDANLPSRTPRAFVLPYSTMLAEKVEKAQVAASSERCKICQVDSDASIAQFDFVGRGPSRTAAAPFTGFLGHLRSSHAIDSFAVRSLSSFVDVARCGRSGHQKSRRRLLACPSSRGSIATKSCRRVSMTAQALPTSFRWAASQPIW